jgi:RHS repeat-associated protein
LDESDTSGNITDEFVFLGSKRIAHRYASGEITCYAEDMLGTNRVILPSAAGSPCYDADFYPFGGEREYTTSCAENYKFEGKKRDEETSNDDFGARYYASWVGRWESPDWSSTPEPVPYANLTNPQTLNLYMMATDDPETFADLDGHCAEDACVVEGAIAVTAAYAFTTVAIQYYRQNPNTGEALAAGASAAHQAVSDAIGKIGSLFHPSTAPQNTAAPASTTGTTSTQGTPASTSQQGAVNTSAIQSGTASTSNSVAQPNPNGQIMVGPGGTAVVIKPGQVAEPASNGKGTVYREPGSTGNANTARGMGPTAASPTGYVRTYNGQGQPVNPSTGKPDSQAKTHTPL